MDAARSPPLIGLEPSVGDEARECLAPLDRISERLGEGGLGGQLDLGRFGPCEERVEQ
jgi:hypothetical protein